MSTERLQEALVALREMRARLEAAERGTREPLAVIGAACRFPGSADSPESYFDMLLAGRDAVEEVPENGRPIGARWAALIGDVTGFEPEFFDISPREARRMDPQQRLLLELTHEAFERAGITRTQIQGSRTGVFVGAHSYSDEYAWLQLRDRRIDAYTATGTGHSILANRISYCFDLRGPSVAMDTACSSSLVAVHAAVRALRAGECDIALAAGANLMLTPEPTRAFARMNLLSPDGRCKTFDAGADGIVRGEGVGVAVLKRLRDAVADGDPILAVVLGSAVNQDGRSNGITAPNGPAQEAVLRAALDDAGVSPADVQYVETHGTGTLLGDPIEVEALAAVLGHEGEQPCWLGAVKTNIGHLEGAAGIAGFIKAVLAVQHSRIPGNLHLRKPNPHLALDATRFRLPTAPIAWDGARIAGVSSFGFGGTNAHIVLGAAPDPSVRADVVRPVVVAISARSADALHELADRYANHLTDRKPALADVAHTSLLHREHQTTRAAFAAASIDELAAGLAAFRAGEDSDDAIAGEAGAEARRMVFVFSGQGGQHEGMARTLLAQETAFRAAVASCDAIFHPLGGWSLLETLEAGTKSDAADVEQPLLFAVQVGLAALWRARGIVPAAVVGHSLGEVAAAHVAGALSLEDAVRIVYHRGCAVEKRAPEGAMAVAAITRMEAESLDAIRAGFVAIAGENAPGSLVLSGPAEAVHDIVRRLEGDGRFARVLPLRRASHSPLMEDAAAALERELHGLAPANPTVPFYASATGGRAHGPLDASYWRNNLRHPVRFAEAFAAASSELRDADFLEIGPHGVLVTPMRQMLGDGDADRVSASLDRDVDAGRWLARVTARLHVRGHEISWKEIASDGGVVELPPTPWVRRSFWLPEARSTAARGDSRESPFPGRRLRSPALDGQVFEGRVTAALVHAFGEHRLGGREIAPAALLLEIVRSALQKDLRAVRFLRPLDVTNGPVTVQTIVRGSSVELHAAREDDWELALTAEAASDTAADLPADSESRPLDVRGGLEDRGPLPAAIDAALRALAGTLGAQDGHVLAAIERVEGVAAADGTLTVRVGAAGDADVCDAAGHTVLRIRGARFAPVDGASAAPVLEMAWQCRNSWAVPAGPRTLPELSGIAPAAANAEDAAAAREFFAGLDPLLSAWSARALAELAGVSLADGTHIPMAALMGAAREAHQRALLERLLGELEADGTLVRDRDGWSVQRMPMHDVDARADELAQRYPTHASQLALVRRCATSLARVVRGADDALDLLFPAEGPGAAAIYGDSAVSRQAHAAAAEAVARAAAARAPGGLRVLEIGAGTGATTRAVLAAVPARSVDYVFTDVSRLFVDAARARFAAHPGVRCELLDVERPPAAQGFGAAAFDIVIANNVLHATQRLSDSLAHAAELLAPGGLLLLVEGVQPARWVDLVFGLTRGWWRFDGDPLRASHPLADIATWRRALAGAGFDGIDAIELPETRDVGGFEQVLLAARASSAARPIDVVSADAGRTVWMAPSAAPDADVLRATVDACAGLLEAVRACTPGTALDVVTRGAHALPGDPPPDPVQAAVWGMGLSLALENPDVRIGLIDVAATAGPTELASALRAFAAADDDERQAAFRSGDRFVPRLARTDVPVMNARIRDAHLVIGGSGALGLRTGEWLASQGAHTIVLASRRGTASDAAIERMRAAGAQVELIALDVTDASAVARIIERFGNDLPPLRGIFHCAMPAGFGGLAQADRDVLESWLGAKVAGSWNLDRATRAHELDHFVLFSSVAGVWGSRGMAPYAAANRFLDALAHVRRSQGLPALSGVWGGWDTGPAREGDRFLERSDLRLLDPTSAFITLHALMSGDAAVRIVADADWSSLARSLRLGGVHRLLDEVAEPARPEAAPEAAEGSVAEKLRRLEPAQALEALDTIVRTEVAEVLGMTPADLIGNGQGFFKLGMDSLTTLELRGRLQRALGMKLPTTVAFEHPTVERLRDHLAGRLGIGAGEASEDELAARLDRVLASLEEIG